MSASAAIVSGRILTGLVGVFMIGVSAIPKFVDWTGKAAMAEHLGLPSQLLPTIGVLEIAVTLVYLIPRTSIAGAILVTGFLGGAVMTHLRIGEPWWFPLLIGGLAWTGLVLRRPGLIHLLSGGTVAAVQPAAGRA